MENSIKSYEHITDLVHQFEKNEEKIDETSNKLKMLEIKRREIIDQIESIRNKLGISTDINILLGDSMYLVPLDLIILKKIQASIVIDKKEKNSLDQEKK